MFDPERRDRLGIAWQAVMEITGLLQRVRGGDRDALNDVIPLVYAELKKLAAAHLRREATAARIETTSLVHEAYLRLAASKDPTYENRAHFFGIASRLMRQILVDSARSRGAEKRGAGIVIAMPSLPDVAAPAEESLLALDEALDRLGEVSHRKIELIEMRYFGGMTAEESAAALGLSPDSVRRELRLAQAWLRKEMTTAASAR
jgi:RNA polymerase sigma-70 factor, ECF subfamily